MELGDRLGEKGKRAKGAREQPFARFPHSPFPLFPFSPGRPLARPGLLASGGWDVWLLPGLALALFLGLWQASTQSVNPLLLPSVTSMLSAWVEIARSGELFGALAQSLEALALGFGLSVVVGVPLGVVLGRFPKIETMVSMYLDVVLATPMIAFVPVVVTTFGLGLASRTIVVFLFTVVVIVVNSLVGVRSTSPELLEMARSFGAGEWPRATKVILPSAIPTIMAGLRLGMGRAISGMITAELIVSAVGLGYLLLYFSASFQTAALFATVLSVVVLGVVLMGLVQSLERRLTSWNSRST